MKMLALSASQLLDVWERGFGQASAEQALTLLSAACPEMSPEALSQLSIGRRNARLLTLREWTFGLGLEALVTCQGCAERLELDLRTTDLLVDAPEDEETEPLSLEADGYTIRFRLPDSTDLVGASGTETATLRRRIFERCLLSVRHGGEEVSFSELPDGVIGLVAERMAQADPQADVTFSVACPACGHTWQATFDIVTFFWREITGWSHRILQEVHLLASAYGWTEADILAMSPWRRQCYVEMFGP